MLSLLMLLAFGTASMAAQDCYVCLKITGTNGWSTPTVWAWSDPGSVNCNTNGNWPGDQMEKVEENLYKWTAPDGKIPTSIIFSNGGDGEATKTANLAYKNQATYVINNPSSSSRPTDVTIEGGDEGGGDDGGGDDGGDTTDISKLPNYGAGYEFFYVYVGSFDWSNLHAWAWSDEIATIPSDEGLSWPGRVLQPVSGYPGYYVWAIATGEIPSTVIITDCDSNNQEKKRFETSYIRGAIYNISGNSGGNVIVDSSHDYSQAPVIGGDTPIANTALGAVSSFAETEHGVKFTCEKGTLELTLYSDGVVKVLSLLNGQNSAERRSVTVSAQPGGTFETIREDGNSYMLATPQVAVKVAKATGLVSFYNPDDTASPLFAESTGFYNQPGNVTATFKAPGSKGFYGAGYSSTFNMINQSLVMNNKQTGGWPDNGNSLLHNICMPYVTADNGYGILFDNHYLGSTLRPGATFTYRSSTPDAVAYYYVAGGNSRKVLENYTHLTGRQELPPYWALGYISSRFGYKNESDASGAIDGIKNIGIPLDGLVLDIYWQSDQVNPYGMGRLDWGSLFPDGPAMTKRFMDKGVNTILITEPFFNNSLSSTQDMINKGFAADTHVDSNSGMSWMCGGSGASLLDVTNPEANEWMWSYYKKRTDEGVTGWWMDLGEPEGYDLDGNTKHKGGTPQQVQNEYGQLWSEGIYNAWKRDYPDMRPFFMPRSGTAGMQRFATFPWTGDIRRSWWGLQVQVPSLLNMSMAGVGYLGSDTGGFIAVGVNNEAMYKRWVAFGCFSPMLRTHVDNANSGNSWAEPFYCSADGQKQVRSLINMRYSYLPYIYTGSYNYTTKGTPLCRPLNFEGDTSLNDNVDGYFFGSDIIVAPVTSENGSSSVTLPAAYGDGAQRAEQWLDITDEDASKSDSDIKYAGATVSFSNVAFDKVPKLARIGSIVPRYKQESYTNTKEFGTGTPIYLDVYSLLNADDEAAGSMFEDDHLSTTSISSGDYNVLTFNVNVSSKNSLTINCDRGNDGLEWKSDRPVIVRFPLRKNNFPKVRTDCFKQSREFVTAGNHTLCGTKEAFDKSTYGQYADETGYYIKTLWPKNSSAMRVYAYDGTTGIEAVESESYNMALSLSSTGGMLHVYFMADDSQDAVVTVVDTVGRSVASAAVSTSAGGNEATFNVAPGIYIVTVNLPDASATGKALVK